MADAYRLWRAELKEPTPEDKRHYRESQPHLLSGFWRIEGARTKPDYPVAIWTEEGHEATIFQIGRQYPMNTVEHAEKWREFAETSWLKCIAVTDTEYEAAQATGRWKDGKPSRQLSEDEKLDLIPDTPASEGGNMPEGGDALHEQLVSRVPSLIQKATALGPIDTLDKANAAAAIIEDLAGLGRKGEARRKEEKQPHLDAATAVDAKWQVVRQASEAVKALKDAIDKFQRAERIRLQREEDERQRKERERLQREAAERIAAEEAERAKLAEQMGMQAEVKSEDDIAAEAAQIAEEKVAETAVAVTAPRVGTEFGRGIKKPKKRRAEIVDKAAFIASLDQQDEFNLFLQTTADRLARANFQAPGIRIIEE